MSETAKLPSEFDALLIQPLEIHEGERGMTVLFKLRRKIDVIIKKHNALVERIEARCNNQVVNVNSVAKVTSANTASAQSVKPANDAKWLNKPQDIIDLLVQFRH